MNYQFSFWEYDTFLRNIDVLVIGAGITGLSAALRLRETSPSARIVVLERGPLPIGASTRNAGFACFGSMTELLDDQQTLGDDALWKLVEKRWRGLEQLRAQVGDAALQFKQWGGYELFKKEESDTYERCLTYIPEFNKMLFPLTGKKDTFTAVQHVQRFGFHQVPYMILNHAEGQLHTGEMMKALLQKVREQDILLLTGMEIDELNSSDQGIEVSTTRGGTIKAEKAIIATNGFTRQFFPEKDVLPARNQVLITAPINSLSLQGTFHYDRGYYYFRNVGNRVLLGGGRNLNPQGETTTEFETTRQIRDALTDLLYTTILPQQPDIPIEQWWSGIMGVGTAKRPIIERVGERCVLACRLGGMGVAIGTAVGREAAELLMES